MKQKFLLLTALAAIVFAKTNAQTTDPVVTTTTTSTANTSGFSWGIRAGADLNNINGKYSNGDRMKNTLQPGFHVGLNAELPIAPDFYLQPGVLFRARGSKLDNDAMNQTYTTEIHSTAIEIPVNFVYKPLLGTGHLIAGLGPYVDFGIGGQVKYSGTGAPANRDIKYQKTVSLSESANTTNAYYRGFGAGGNLLFGYEFANRLSFQLNAQLGLTDINPSYEANPDMKKSTYTGFGLSAGYRF